MSNSICVFAVILLGVSSINADGFQQELQKLRTGNMEKLTSGTMEDMTGFDESELTSLMNSMEMSLKIEMEHAVLQYKTQSEEALLNELDSILKREKNKREELLYDRDENIDGIWPGDPRMFTSDFSKSQ